MLSDMWVMASKNKLIPVLHGSLISLEVGDITYVMSQIGIYLHCNRADVASTLGSCFWVSTPHPRRDRQSVLKLAVLEGNNVVCKMSGISLLIKLEK